MIVTSFEHSKPFKRKGTNNMKVTIVNILAIILLLTILSFPFIGWCKNLGKLAACDFQAPYKAEIIHGIGVVPVVGAVTGWMDLGR